MTKMGIQHLKELQSPNKLSTDHPLKAPIFKWESYFLTSILQITYPNERTVI